MNCLIAVFLAVSCLAYATNGQSDLDQGSCSCEMSFKKLFSGQPCIPSVTADTCVDGTTCICSYDFLSGCSAACGTAPSTTDEEKVMFEFDGFQADSNCTCYFNWRKFWKGCQVETDECSADAPTCSCSPYHQGSFCAGVCSAETEQKIELVSQEE
eukprot:TRINITY_DN18282_c1_g2_i1.p1 TRINITY_DN18282_c1_g2~~TRINITY_DN18282_c1_g2_i1.p1  ORF type:complete len:181 (+),score=24.19 TRINITY_DN18282_c1_g2_i1:78-545(+)